MTWAKGLAAAALVLTCGLVPVSLALGDETFATLRNHAIDQEPKPPPLTNETNDDLRKPRNYPEQPPTIPHKIRDYQVDLNVNKCLTCHGRTAVGQSQAPMVSVTHYTDRDGQVRAFMSPRRYFCNQCHVVQAQARPLVGNDFVDVEALVLGLGDKKGD